MNVGVIVSLLLVAVPLANAQPVVVHAYPSPDEVQALCRRDDRLLATTSSGRTWSVAIADLRDAILRFSSLSPRWHLGSNGCSTQPLLLPDSIAGFQITSQAELAGKTWYGTFGGGLRDSTGEPVLTSPPNIRDLEILDDRLLLGHAQGLAVFDGTAVRELQLAGPPAAAITALAWTGDTLWLGTFDRGLARKRSDHWQRIPASDDHRGRWVNSLCWDGAVLWVGSGAGLGKWRESDDRIERVPEVVGSVQSIRCDGSSLVVTTGNAVWLRREALWQQIALPKEALHTAVLVDHDLWAAGLRGILQRRDGRWKRYSELNGALPDSWVTALLSCAGSLWAGTYDAGLLRRDRTGSWQIERAELWVNPNALVELSNGMAVGSMGSGVHLRDAATGRWQRLTTADGLPQDNVTALLTVGESLWVGTDDGLARVDWPTSG